MSDELVDLMKKPMAMTETAITNLTKKAAATFWGKLKRQLSTASEPFFRKDMGERYLSTESLVGGCFVWIMGNAIAIVLPQSRSIVPSLCESVHLFGLERFFQYLMLNGMTTILVGGAFIFFHMRFGLQSTALMLKYRAEGTPYHTQSRGVPRWGKNNIMVAIGMTVVLFIFNMPLGILFVASCALSAKLSGEQQAAIYARYLDSLDQKIEQEYLESAILGECPLEITQLHQPLPAHMNADLRTNIAAAAVGKPVSIVAKGPRRAGAQPAAQNPPVRTGNPIGVSPQPSQNPRAGVPGVAMPQAFEAAQPEAVQQETGMSADERPTVAAPVIQPTAAPKPNTNTKFLIGIIGFLSVALIALAVVHFWPAKAPKTPVPLAATPMNVQPVQPKVIPTPSPPPAQIVQRQPQQTQPAVAPVAAPQPVALTQPANPPAVESNPIVAPEVSERDKQLQECTNTLAEKVAALAKFTAECETKLDANDAKIPSFGPADREILKHNNDSARKTMEKSLKIQADVLKSYQVVLREYSDKSRMDPQSTIERLTNYYAKMDKIHGEFMGIFASLNKDFTPDPH